MLAGKLGASLAENPERVSDIEKTTLLASITLSKNLLKGFYSYEKRGKQTTSLCELAQACNITEYELRSQLLRTAQQRGISLQAFLSQLKKEYLIE